MTRIILSGLVRALVFAPLAVFVLGKARQDPTADEPNPRLVMTSAERVRRLSILSIAHAVVYFLFGYFVAWQWAETRQFYSGTTDLLPFFAHMANTFRADPALPLFQLLRGFMWAGLALPIVRMFKGGRVETSMAVALTFSVLLATLALFPNPYMPTLVRQSHFFELSSSMLVFGALTGWTLTKK